MAGKLTFLAGLGAGYVLGTRSGRQRYDQMVDKAKSLWQDPRVQEATEKVQHMAEERMPGGHGEGTGSRTSPVTGSAPGQGADGGVGR